MKYSPTESGATKAISRYRALGLCFCLGIGMGLGDAAAAREDCSQSLGDGLELYLKMDGNMLDSSGNGRDGTALGDLQYGAGVIGTAAAFDGIDDAVLVPGLPDDVFSDGDFTISFWFALPIDPRHSVISKRPICNSGPFLDLRIESFQCLELEIDIGGQGDSIVSHATYDEGWHHYVGIRQGLQLFAYIDSVLVGTAADAVAL